MEAQALLGAVGWWWVVSCSVPFALYSIPFVMGSFHLYKHLTISALAGRHDIAGLHILEHRVLWQVHSFFGLVYMAVAPLQFSSSFRARHLQLHRQLGYAFVVASSVLGTTGCTTMLLHSEFGTVGRVFLGASGGLHLLCLAMAMIFIKLKRIQEHRRWMIRTAAMGYPIINSRLALIILQKVFNVPVFTAADYCIAVAWGVSVALVELYIHVYLPTPNKKVK